MSSLVQPQSSQVSQSPQDRPKIFRKQKDKPLQTAALGTQPSRRHHWRSPFGNLVSRILPSRRPEKGYTMRSEFKEEGPLSAVDLVFGFTGPREADNIESSKNREVAKGNHHGMAHAQSVRLAAHKEYIGGDVNERMVEWAGVDARAKNKALKTLLGSRPTQEHDVGGPSPGFAASQQQQTSFRLPSLHLENKTLGLQFQKPATDIHEEGEVSNSQRIYEAKRSRREQRRSLVESGDFLGVQGANPRTGYWDISTGTTSSDPSQLSSETRKKLQHQAKEVEEHWQNYAQAQEKYIVGLEMVQTLKRKKEAEKMEQKQRQLRLRQRRRGRWNAGENGWSSVAEPDLSPVVQSVAGSPVKGSSYASLVFLEDDWQFWTISCPNTNN